MDGAKLPVVLCVVDGVGVRESASDNAFTAAKTPIWDRLSSDHASTKLIASGAAVGQEPDHLGSGEIGYLALGAGRPVISERARFDEVVSSGRLAFNEAVDQVVRVCIQDERRMHLFGLLSDGGIHADLEHLFAIIDQVSFQEVPIALHLVLDGHGTGQRRAMDYLERIQIVAEDFGNVSIATLSGRYYAMDRDERWDRTSQAFQAIVRDPMLGGAAPHAETVFDAVSGAHMSGLSDQHLVPTRIGDYEGLKGDFQCDFAGESRVWEWAGEEVGLAFNFRGDRFRQLSAMLTREGAPSEVRDDLLMDGGRPIRAFQEGCYATMVSHGEGLGLPVAFPPQPVANSLGEVLEQEGLRQLRLGESDSAVHFTQFFSGGREQPFRGEERQVVASQMMADSYDEVPACSAPAVAEKVSAALAAGDADFLLVNLGNVDLVAHTGDFDATVCAVQEMDRCLGVIAAAAESAGAHLLITSSHGNCEQMEDDSHDTYPGHTSHDVPLLYVAPTGSEETLRQGGSLIDVAPTVLQLLGVTQPEQMTGTSLLQRDPG